jgi:hypothetical protein
MDITMVDLCNGELKRAFSYTLVVTVFYYCLFTFESAAASYLPQKGLGQLKPPDSATVLQCGS